MSRDWFLGGYSEPDRVERLLSSCRSYYLKGDRDIAALLLREIEKELVKPPPLEHELEGGLTEQLPQIGA